jgi:hypothetical protein
MLPYFSTGFLDVVKQGMDYTTSLRRVFLSIFMANMFALPPKFGIQLGWPVFHWSGMLGHMAQHAASAAGMCRACPWRTMPDRTEWLKGRALHELRQRALQVAGERRQAVRAEPGHVVRRGLVSVQGYGFP